MKKDLQYLLDKLNEWCLKWKMQVNQSKNNVAHFRQKGNASYTLENVDLKVVDRYRYLGIVFNEYLDFNVCVDVLLDAGGRALGAIIGKTRHLKNIGFKSFRKSFDTCVLTVLEYGSEVWVIKMLNVLIIFWKEQ